MHNLCSISLVTLTFILDIVFVGFLEIPHHISSMSCKVMEAYKGKQLSHILVYEFDHIIKTGGLGLRRFLFLTAQVTFMDERCSETPQFMTTEWDIRSPSFC